MRNAADDFPVALRIARAAILFFGTMLRRQIVRRLRRFAQTKARQNRRLREYRDVCRAGASPVSLGNRSGCPTIEQQQRSRASHVRARAGVDLDGFAFLDEKRDVNGFACFELRRLGDVAGRIAANAFW